LQEDGKPPPFRLPQFRTVLESRRRNPRSGKVRGRKRPQAPLVLSPHLPKAPAVRSSFQAGFFFCVQDFPLVFVLDRKDLFPDTFSNSWKRRQ